MQVFEFHFNPKTKEDLIFDSFCYEPENIYERRIGSLYMAGIFKNALPQNFRFLENLAKVIKGRYYRLTLKNPERALKESLKEANEFLEQMVKRGDVRWLGNLSFAVISLKNFELNFTKVGDLKIFLLRRGRVIDIDRKLKFEDITPWPVRIFGNIVSGKLAENDVILVSTKAVTDFFERENLLPEFAKFEPFNEERIKEIFDKKREEVLKISGVCLAIVLTKEISAGKKEVISPKLYPKEFNLKQVFSPIFQFFKKIKIKRPKPSIKFPKFKLPKPKLLKGVVAGWHLKFPKLSKNQISVLALIFLLTMGFFIFQLEEKQKLKEYQFTLSQIQEKVNQAEGFLVLKETNLQAGAKANSLFRESWEDISFLVRTSQTLPKNFANQVLSLKSEIAKNLYQLNNLITIEEPQLIFEFSPKEFIPQKMIIFNNEFYFFSPYSQNLFKLNKELKSEIIETEQKFNLAIPWEDSIAFFSKSNQLTILKDREQFTVYLGEPYPDFNFNSLASFKGNLYFLDQKIGEIIKYPTPISEGKDNPKIWLSPQTKKAIGAKSLAVDGSIWILNKDNSISRYYAGGLQETLKLEIFPEIKDFSEIFTLANLLYLYILEPAQNRIIVINKTGQIIKQFQSQKFDNLLDFTVSKDGKTIYLLNGLKVYQILITGY